MVVKLALTLVPSLLATMVNPFLFSRGGWVRFYAGLLVGEGVNRGRWQGLVGRQDCHLVTLLGKVGVVRVLVAIINIVKVPGVVEVVVGKECKASLTLPKQPGQGKRSQPG